VMPLDGAIALGAAGSKVLLTDALEYARQHGVSLHAGATSRPSGTGTALPPGQAPDVVTAIAADAQLLQVRVGALSEADALSGMARAWWTEGGQLFALLDRRNLHDEAMIPASWSVIGPAATVTAVGRQAVTDPRVVASAVAAVPGRWWASGATWSAMVAPQDADDAQRALHAALIG
jgi:aspartokinase